MACFEGLGLRNKRTKEEQHVGGYRLGPILGRGAFANVRFGTHSATSQKVAVKIVAEGRMREEDLRNEIKNHCSLEHKHIVKVHDVIRRGRTTHMVMEYAPSRLNDVFKGGSDDRGLPEQQAKRILGQVLEAVDFCHKNGIVHRDIKPDNILLDEQGDVKLADFGLSTKFTAGEKLNRACGSPSYIAPEILDHNNREYDGAKADVWSIGVVLYILLSGQKPFHGATVHDTLLLVKSSKYEMPAAASVQAQNLLARLMHPDPAQRCSPQEALQHPWMADYFGNSFAAAVATEVADRAIDSSARSASKGSSASKERDQSLCSTELDFVPVHAYTASCCPSSMESFGSLDSSF